MITPYLVFNSECSDAEGGHGMNSNECIFKTTVSSVCSMYVQKAEKKGRTKELCKMN